jgi:cyclopropane fatty-acyl-phospholipid synthase-like methyltransferase
MSDLFTNYELYAAPYTNRLRNEVEKVRASKPDGPFVASDFSHFDSLHYCGHNYIEEFLEAEHISSNSKVLELCAGNGSTSRFVAERFKPDLTAVDYLPEYNDLHEKMNTLCGITSTKIVQGDATKLDLQALNLEKQCDVVYSLQSFYYIANKPDLFAVCNNALKIGGKLYIEDHTLENNIPLIEKEEEIAQTFQFISRLTRPEYCKLLEDAGFHVDDYTFRTTEWSRYLYNRSENFLRDKQKIIDEYGEALWNTRHVPGIHISCRLYHQLGMTLEEAKQAYPLTLQEFGEEEFEKWVCEMPEKFGGAYIKATKIRHLS